MKNAVVSTLLFAVTVFIALPAADAGSFGIRKFMGGSGGPAGVKQIVGVKVQGTEMYPACPSGYSPFACAKVGNGNWTGMSGKFSMSSPMTISYIANGLTVEMVDEKAKQGIGSCDSNGCTMSIYANGSFLTSIQPWGLYPTRYDAGMCACLED